MSQYYAVEFQLNGAARRLVQPGFALTQALGDRHLRLPPTALRDVKDPHG
jgi:hypothetical protein